MILVSTRIVLKYFCFFVASKMMLSQCFISFLSYTIIPRKVDTIEFCVFTRSHKTTRSYFSHTMYIDHPTRSDAPSSSITPNMPRPNGLASHSDSESLHRDAPRSGISSDGLLEDWPHRLSDFSSNDRDWKSPYKTIRHRNGVTISECSSLQLYDLDPTYAKSYSKEDCKRFSRDSMIEAARIKRLVLSSTPPGASTKETLKYLIDNDTILMEEIRGIEHLVLCKSASKLLHRRRDHAKAVVSMQHHMVTFARYPMKQGKMHCDHVEKLASFSATRSSRSTKHARIRASRAA